MKIADICSRQVVALAGNEPLQRAALLMREQHVGSVVVTEAGEEGVQVLGLVTDRDLAIEVLARGGDASTVPVARLVQGPSVTVSAEADLETAIDIMCKAGVRRLLVHDADNHLVGLLSFDDLLPALAAPLAGLADVLRIGREREVQQRGAIAAPPRAPLRVPAMGTAGWQGAG